MNAYITFQTTYSSIRMVLAMLSTSLLSFAILVHGLRAFSSVGVGSELLSDEELRRKIEAGREQLELVLFGDEDGDPECWRESLVELMEDKCSSLSFNSRSLTALKLTLCQLKERGVHTLNEDHCSYEPAQCLEDIYKSNDVAFATYNNLFAQIDNICIYVTMRGHEERMQRSMHSLYAATMDSADYLVSTQRRHREFEEEIVMKHDELRRSNEDLLSFQEQHQESIQRVESMATDIEWRQSDIAEQQTRFQVKQDLFYQTVTQIDRRQEAVLQNQQEMEHRMDSLNRKQSVLKEHIDRSIEVQEESMEHQHRIHDEAQRLHEDIQRNHDQIDSFWAESVDRQQAILEKQDDALGAMEVVEGKTSALREEAVLIEEEMGRLFESQRIEIEAAKQEIEGLTTESANAFTQIMAVVDELLFWVQAIYRIDVHLLGQIGAVQSCALYLFWCVLSFIATIPAAARSARIWLFCSLSLCVLIETNLMHRMLAHCLPDRVPLESDYYLLSDGWRCWFRQSMFTLNMALYFWFVLTFKDRGQEQMELLHRIESKVRRAPRVRTSSITFASALSSITPKNMWRRFRK